MTSAAASACTAPPATPWKALHGITACSASDGRVRGRLQRAARHGPHGAQPHAGSPDLSQPRCQGRRSRLAHPWRGLRRDERGAHPHTHATALSSPDQACMVCIPDEAGTVHKWEAGTPKGAHQAPLSGYAPEDSVILHHAHPRHGLHMRERGEDPHPDTTDHDPE